MSHFRKEKLWKQSFPASQGKAGIVLIEPMTVKLYVAQVRRQNLVAINRGELERGRGRGRGAGREGGREGGRDEGKRKGGRG